MGNLSVWAAAAAVMLSLPAEANSVRVAVGQQRVVTRASITKAAIGDDKVADVRALSTRELLVTGVSPGRTSLTIFGSGGTEQLSVIVAAMDEQVTEREVSRVIRGLRGVRIKQVGGRLILEGKVNSVKEHRRLSLVRELFPSVINMVVLAPEVRTQVADALTSRLRQAGYTGVEASLVGPTLFLEGTVPSVDDQTKLSELVKTAGVAVENLVKVGNRRMVLIECQFVEVRKNRNDLLGVRLPLQITGKGQMNLSRGWGLLPSSSADSGELRFDLGGESPFSFGLQFNNGYGRLLAQPRLLASSGQQANFLAGGEVPIIKRTLQGVDVEYKEFGVRLGVLPQTDRLGNINMDITAEVSAPDAALAVDNIPGFRTRRVQTNVNAIGGETIVLSGIYNNDEQKNVSKFPGLGHIPIVGELFKSRAWLEKKSELVILLTPRLVGPGSKRVRRLIDDAQRMYERSGQEVRFNIWD